MQNASHLEVNTNYLVMIAKIILISHNNRLDDLHVISFLEIKDRFYIQISPSLCMRSLFNLQYNRTCSGIADLEKAVLEPNLKIFKHFKISDNVKHSSNFKNKSTC